MLSLEKTKNIDEINSFLNKKPYVAMLKMDGLTCSLKYINGQLVSAETRGNGKMGEDILHNARILPSIPQQISYKEELVVDGEIICSYKDFEHFSSEYKNPRNFAAGSIRLLDANECAKRKLQFVAWDIITDFSNHNSFVYKLDKLQKLGFIVVPYHYYDIPLTEELVDKLKKISEKNAYPIDGLVIKLEDIKYGKSLGQTSHHFKNAMALKFYDEVAETVLTNIEWTMGRTATLTPVAVYEPIELEGSLCLRASMHNISTMQEFLGKKPYYSQKIAVVKKNQIIPQIIYADQDDEQTNFKIFEIPKMCPICGEPTEIRQDYDSKVLYCTNPQCNGLLVNKIEHFFGKKGLDCKGISKATIEKLIDWDWLYSIHDVFELKEHRDEWIKKPGFGQKSVDNILSAIEECKNCDLDKFIAALGIPLIGTKVSRELSEYFRSWSNFINAITTKFKFKDLPNFGYEMEKSLLEFDYKIAIMIEQKYLNINNVEDSDKEDSELTGKTIVITGKLNNFKNRTDLAKEIEKQGGKVSSAVSSKTDYLINNDINSTSSKNIAAKKFGIPILTEEEFIKNFKII